MARFQTLICAAWLGMAAISATRAAAPNAAPPPAAATASAPAGAIAPAGGAALAPYVGAAEADKEFRRITATDMEILRAKRVLFGSRSSGLCLREGLAALAARDHVYAMPLSPVYSPAYGNQPKEVPDDAPKSFALIHYLFTGGSTADRAKEFEGLVTRFAPRLDAAMLDLHVLGAEMSPSRAAPDRLPIDELTRTLDRLRKDRPAVRFVYATCRLVPDPNFADNEKAWQVSEKLLQKYRGQVPVYDWRSLLATHADGTVDGHHTCLEFNINHDRMHPNAPFAKERLARAYLVIMYKLFCPPRLAANAGFDRTVPAGAAGGAKVVLDGSASVDNRDPSRRIAKFVWRESDKVLADTDKPTAEVTLPAGPHTITLTVTSDTAPPQTSGDDVRITVAQPAP